MKIAIDCGSVSPGKDNLKTGLYTMTVNLVRWLAKIDKRNRYLLYSFHPLPADLIGNHPGMVNRVLPRWGFKTVWMRLALKFDRPDAFIAMSQALGNADIPTVGVVYDLAYEKYPKNYSRAERLKKNTDELVRHSQKIVTISQSSRRDIISIYGVDDNKISVLYPGADDIFTHEGPKYLAQAPYFLHVGTLKTSKNIPLLLEAFAAFLEKWKMPYLLVLVGGEADLDPRISRTIRRMGLEKQVVRTGYVPVAELVKYYRGARALIITSDYEGFGLPTVEAFRSGTPVVAVESSSIPETVKGVGLVVKPKTAGLSEAMYNLAADGKLVKQLARRGLKEARKYSWRKFARGVLDIINTL